MGNEDEQDIGVFFPFSLFLCTQRLPEVDAALWYGGTKAQKYEVKKFFKSKGNWGNGKKGKELNDLAQYWAKLNAIFGV